MFLFLFSAEEVDFFHYDPYDSNTSKVPVKLDPVRVAILSKDYDKAYRIAQEAEKSTHHGGRISGLSHLDKILQMAVQKTNLRDFRGYIDSALKKIEKLFLSFKNEFPLLIRKISCHVILGQTEEVIKTNIAMMRLLHDGSTRWVKGWTLLFWSMIETFPDHKKITLLEEAIEQEDYVVSFIACKELLKIYGPLDEFCLYYENLKTDLGLKIQESRKKPILPLNFFDKFDI